MDKPKPDPNETNDMTPEEFKKAWSDEGIAAALDSPEMQPLSQQGGQERELTKVNRMMHAVIQESIKTSGISEDEIEQKWEELNANDGDIRIMAMLHELLLHRRAESQPLPAPQNEEQRDTYTSVHTQWTAYKKECHSRGIGGKDETYWLTEQLVIARNTLNEVKGELHDAYQTIRGANSLIDLAYMDADGETPNPRTWKQEAEELRHELEEGTCAKCGHNEFHAKPLPAPVEEGQTDKDAVIANLVMFIKRAANHSKPESSHEILLKALEYMNRKGITNPADILRGVSSPTEEAGKSESKGE